MRHTVLAALLLGLSTLLGAAAGSADAEELTAVFVASDRPMS